MSGAGGLGGPAGCSVSASGSGCLETASGEVLGEMHFSLNLSGCCLGCSLCGERGLRQRLVAEHRC